jgi:hypothetical protein
MAPDRASQNARTELWIRRLGTGDAVSASMGDKRRELLALRAIVVSGRAAMRHATNPDGRERIKDRVTELLARLEEAVIRDGADSEVLARLEEARRDVWE